MRIRGTETSFYAGTRGVQVTAGGCGSHPARTRGWRLTGPGGGSGSLTFGRIPPDAPIAGCAGSFSTPFTVSMLLCINDCNVGDVYTNTKVDEVSKTFKVSVTSCFLRWEYSDGSTAIIQSDVAIQPNKDYFLTFVFQTAQGNDASSGMFIYINGVRVPTTVIQDFTFTSIIDPVNSVVDIPSDNSGICGIGGVVSYPTGSSDQDVRNDFNNIIKLAKKKKLPAGILSSVLEAENPLILGSGADVISSNYAYTMTGGLNLSGSATASNPQAYSASGKLTLSGHASNFDVQMTGGIRLDGTSEVTTKVTYSPSGKVILGGHASNFDVQMTGGISLTGDPGEVLISLHYNASGKAILGSSASSHGETTEVSSEHYVIYDTSISRLCISSSFDVVYGSVSERMVIYDTGTELSCRDAIWDIGTEVTGSGGLFLSGSATAQRNYSHTGSGILIIGGEVDAGYFASGGLTISDTSFAWVSPVGQGGLRLTGTTDATGPRDITGEGGMQLGGSASVNFASAVYPASGNLIIGSTSDAHETLLYEAGGSVIISGGVTIFNGSGKVTLGGTSDVQLFINLDTGGVVNISGPASFLYGATGGLTLSGTTTTYNASGLLTLSNGATSTLKISYNPSGDLIIGSGITLYNGSGDIKLGGSADVHLTPNGSGGLIISGSATEVLRFNYAASGGLIISGAASTFELTFGNLIIGSSATETVRFIYVASGNVIINGASITPFVGSGAIILGGTADVRLSIALEASGGLVISGSANSLSKYLYTGTGGLLIGESASETIKFTYDPSGHILLDGESLTNPYLARGRLVIGGSADAGLIIIVESEHEILYNVRVFVESEREVLYDIRQNVISKRVVIYNTFAACAMTFNFQKQKKAGHRKEGAFIPKVTVCLLEKENRLEEMLEREEPRGRVPLVRKP